MPQETPTPEAHYAKATHNQAWAEHLITIPHPDKSVKPAYDWVATKAYYSAIHYLDGFLLTKSPNVNFQGRPRRISSVDEFLKEFSLSMSFHSARNVIVKNIAFGLREDWNFLWDAADSARYKLQEVSAEIARESLRILPTIRKRFFVVIPPAVGPAQATKRA